VQQHGKYSTIAIDIACLVEFAWEFPPLSPSLVIDLLYLQQPHTTVSTHTCQLTLCFSLHRIILRYVNQGKSPSENRTSRSLLWVLLQKGKNLLILQNFTVREVQFRSVRRIVNQRNQRGLVSLPFTQHKHVLLLVFLFSVFQR
jgi:hypothetical protein